MNRRSVLAGIAGLFSWPFVRTQTVYGNSSETSSVTDDRHDPNGLVVHFEPTTEGHVARISGTSEAKIVFFNAWLTFCCTDWESNMSDYVRAIQSQYFKYVRNGGDGLFWIDCTGSWRFDAVMYAINRCGIECQCFGGFAEASPTPSESPDLTQAMS